MSEHDRRLRETIADSYTGLRFDERMKEAVRQRASQSSFEGRHRLERAGLVAAAVAVFTIGLSASLLFVTPARTTRPDYVIAELPAAALVYQEGRK